MSFLFSWDLPDGTSHLSHTRTREAWAAYEAHLDRIKRKLRPATREFALAAWHYDMNDSRCPHDAWLASLMIDEPASGERQEIRHTEIRVRLLGSYHDGHLELRYENVFSYAFDYPMGSGGRGKGHGDWLVDEIRFSERGKIIHEIEWSTGCRWVIECDDVHHSWHPFEGDEGSTAAPIDVD